MSRHTWVGINQVNMPRHPFRKPEAVERLSKMPNLQSLDIWVGASYLRDPTSIIGYRWQPEKSLPQLAQIATLPTRPSVKRLTICDAKLDAVYAICSVLAPLTIGHLVIGEMRGDVDISDLAAEMFEQSLRQSAEPLHLSVRKLVSLHSLRLLRGLVSHIIDPKCIRRFDLGGANLNRNTYEAVETLTPYVVDLAWGWGGFSPVDITSLQWPSLRRLKADALERCMPILNASHRTLEYLEVSGGGSLSQSQSTVLHNMTGVVSRCTRLNTLHLTSLSFSTVRDAHILAPLRQLIELCEVRDITLTIVGSCDCKHDIRECRSFLALVAPYLKELQLYCHHNVAQVQHASSISTDFTASGFSDTLMSIAPLEMPRLERLTVRLSQRRKFQTRDDPRIMSAVAQLRSALNFVAQQSMPVLFYISFTVSSTSIDYLLHLASILSARHFQYLQSFSGTFWLDGIRHADGTWDRTVEGKEEYPRLLIEACEAQALQTRLDWHGFDPRVNAWSDDSVAGYTLD